MLLRRKITIAVAGLALGGLVSGGVAGLTLWYVREGVGPLLQDAPTAALLLDRGPWLVTGTVVLFLLGAVAAGGWLLRSLRRSLRSLEHAVEQVQAGRLDQSFSIDTSDELGRIARALNRMTTTLSQRTVSRTYLQAVLDSMAELLFVVDGEGRVQRANEAAADALGCPKEALRTRPLADYFDADPLTAEGDGPIECLLTPEEGPSRPVLVSRSPLHGTAPEAGDFVCVAQDITERKEAEEQLRRSLEEKEVLLREIHHRVKNNLQVISSLLHAQARGVDDPAVRERFRGTRERIRSMATIHEHLYQSDDLARIDFHAYLDTLLEELFRSHPTDRIHPHLEADDRALPIDQAIPAGLIVNELVSNALEHAFPDGQSGTVSVVFRVQGNEVTLTVADDGSGTDALESGASLGLRLVRGLTRQLRGSLSTDTDSGVQVRVTFPLDPSA